jgi:hypothetical protein
MTYGFTAQVSAGTAATGFTQTVNFTVAPGDTLIEVYSAYSGAVTTAALSDGTHTYIATGGGGVVTSTLTHRMVTAYVLAPTPGSYTLTLTLGGTRANRRVAVVTRTGISAFQTAVSQGQVAAATTTDAVSTSNMTPTSQPAMLSAASFTASGTATYTQGTGHTSRGALSNWDAIGSFSSLLEDIRLTSTSAVSGLFTIGTSRDTLSSGLVFTESSPDVTLALTGQAATAAAGSVGPAIAYTPTGQAATVAQGTATNAVSYAPTGQALTATTGSLAPSLTAALTGQSSTVAQGSTPATVSYTPTGQAIGAAQGTLGTSLARALSGQQASLAQGVLSVPGDVTIALTGQSIGVAQGTLTATASNASDAQSGVTRQWLTELYTREWSAAAEKRKQEEAEEAERRKAERAPKRQPRVHRVERVQIERAKPLPAPSIVLKPQQMQQLVHEALTVDLPTEFIKEQTRRIAIRKSRRRAEEAAIVALFETGAFL